MSGPMMMMMMMTVLHMQMRMPGLRLAGEPQGTGQLQIMARISQTGMVQLPAVTTGSLSMKRPGLQLTIFSRRTHNFGESIPRGLFSGLSKEFHNRGVLHQVRHDQNHECFVLQNLL